MAKITNKQNTTSETSFARDLGLFDATMIGVGAMIGAGIFVLTGIASGEAGPASILAFALNGAVTLLTAFAYAELASAVPRAGGGYSFVRMAFPGATGFIAGWLLWFAYTVACSLYALGFAGYFWEFFHKYFPHISESFMGFIGTGNSSILVTLIIGILFIWLNVRGAEVTGKTENILTLSKIAVLGIFIFFGILQITEEPVRAAESFNPFFPQGFGGVLIAMGLTFIAFEGYDLIATVAEEIKNPEKNIPRATFISLGLTVFMYLLILFVSLGAINPQGMPAWEFLGKYQETAIVRAAENFMPAFGVAVIVFGGILSTMSALNATVMAASRVAFSMGRDKWLPGKMSFIHPKRRTPQTAIVATGIILLATAAFVPLEAVGSAASLIFLITFAMVNLSVIVLRRKHPEIPRRYKVPFYPVVPVLGFLLNIFLAVYQFNFQPIAWYITIAWIAVGLLLYFAVFERRAAGFSPQVILPGVRSYETEKQKSVIVSLYNPDNIIDLLAVAAAVAAKKNLRVIAITVVDVPRQMPIHEGMRFANHKEPLLKAARKYAGENHFKLATDLVIAHSVADGIIAASERHNADTLVMGWKGYTNARDRIFGEMTDKIVRLSPCDLILYKIAHDRTINKCLFPTAGGPNAKLAANILSAVADKTDFNVTPAYVVPVGADSDARKNAANMIETSIEGFDKEKIIEKKIIESDSVPAGIAKTAKEYDIIVIGAAKEPLFRKMLFGEIPEKTARFSPTSVLMVKKYEGAVKSIFKKIMG